jgi:adenylylsulfate kinase
MALGFRNLAAVWQNYRDAGARCLIIPSLLDFDDQAEVRKAVPGADI